MTKDEKIERFKAIYEEYDIATEKLEALLDEGFELREIIEILLDY